jgi:hypothetical protein
MESTIKALKENMHEMALIWTQVRDIQEANTTLNQNKRRKRTRLQYSGNITIGNAQDQIDQIDIDMQVVTESSISGGLGGSEGPRVCYYSKCGKAGHNVRTCQEVIEVIEEEDSN